MSVQAYYLDSSALLKRYVQESGSQWVRALLAEPSALIFISGIALVEVVSAFARRTREGVLTTEEFSMLRGLFRADYIWACQIVEPSLSIIERAAELVSRHPLRSLDAIHLATALSIHDFLVRRNLPALIFVCADNRLNLAAKTKGLRIENPNSY